MPFLNLAATSALTSCWRWLSTAKRVGSTWACETWATEASLSAPGAAFRVQDGVHLVCTALLFQSTYMIFVTTKYTYFQVSLTHPKASLLTAHTLIIYGKELTLIELLLNRQHWQCSTFLQWLELQSRTSRYDLRSRCCHRRLWSWRIPQSNATQPLRSRFWELLEDHRENMPRGQHVCVDCLGGSQRTDCLRVHRKYQKRNRPAKVSSPRLLDSTKNNKSI